ncbi:MAG: hypothetical protein RLZZ505_1779 [Verrucomicrobiota bacterium]|jgi:hypothetical protein
MNTSEQEDWNEKDATWELLGKAAPRKAGQRFADDTLRAVRLLPEADPWWPKLLRSSPWVAMATCVALALVLLNNPADDLENPAPSMLNIISESGSSLESEQWGELEAVAEEEMLAAAADHLDRFSDQELVTLIGF